MAGRISRHKLGLLDIPDYQRALLRRGVNHWVQEEAGSEDLELGMEFSSAIGTMLMDKMVDINERVSDCIDLVMD